MYVDARKKIRFMWINILCVTSHQTYLDYYSLPDQTLCCVHAVSHVDAEAGGDRCHGIPSACHPGDCDGAHSTEEKGWGCLFM